MTPKRERGAGWWVALLVLAALGAGGYALFRLAGSIERSDIRREGPAALVMDETPQLWVMVKFEEHASVRSMGRYGTRYQLELQAHDTRNGNVQWARRLRSVGSNEGGHGAQARILGQEGKVVWLFVHDQPVAVSAADGAVLATREQIEQRNPALRTLVPTELKYYTFDRGLVFVAADARRYRVDAPGYAATPYVPADEQQFSSMQYMSTTWNGGYDTKDFMTPQATVTGRWHALYTDKEAASAANDEWGDKLKNPKAALGSDPLARRALWTARPRATKDKWGGGFERLFDVERVQGAPEFLSGGFLIDQGKKTPLFLNAHSALVLHRTRVDALGRLALTRLDMNDGARAGWSATLPFAELRSRWQWPHESPDRLLTIGQVQVTERGITRYQEHVVVVDLRDGRTQGWNLTYGEPLSAQ